MRLRYLVPLLALTSAGCMVGPDYVRPTAPTPAAYKEADGWKVAQPADTLPRGNWWEAYNDPTLNGLMAQVDVDNFNIALYEARVRQANAGTQAARAALWPLVDLGAGRVAQQYEQQRERPQHQQRVQRPARRELGARTSGAASVATSSPAGATPRRAKPILANARPVGAGVACQNYFLLRVQDAQIALSDDTSRGTSARCSLTRNQYNAGIVARGDVAQAGSAAQVHAGAGVRRATVARAARACGRRFSSASPLPSFRSRQIPR
jgi:outer membrane protein TolC